MIFRIIGAVLVLAGCGGFGFYVAYTHREQAVYLEQLIRVLEYMECELLYRHPPLSELMQSSGRVSSGKLQRLFMSLAKELEKQLYPDAAVCMASVLDQFKDLPGEAYDALVQIGRSLGVFDAEGQCKGLRSVRYSCEHSLKELTANQDTRMRTYRTLGICGGAAMVILFI